MLEVLIDAMFGVNMEEDNNIRAAGNGFFYGPNSIHCKGQWKMAANC
jgi:hypothetical protein